MRSTGSESPQHLRSCGRNTPGCLPPSGVGMPICGAAWVLEGHQHQHNPKCFSLWAWDGDRPRVLTAQLALLMQIVHTQSRRRRLRQARIRGRLDPIRGNLDPMTRGRRRRQVRI
jgi:hypothetical protein